MNASEKQVQHSDEEIKSICQHILPQSADLLHTCCLQTFTDFVPSSCHSGHTHSPATRHRCAADILCKSRHCRDRPRIVIMRTSLCSVQNQNSSDIFWKWHPFSTCLNMYIYTCREHERKNMDVMNILTKKDNYYYTTKHFFTFLCLVGAPQ